MERQDKVVLTLDSYEHGIMIRASTSCATICWRNSATLARRRCALKNH